jgi:hypothetical protein
MGVGAGAGGWGQGAGGWEMFIGNVIGDLVY